MNKLSLFQFSILQRASPSPPGVRCKASSSCSTLFYAWQPWTNGNLLDDVWPGQTETKTAAKTGGKTAPLFEEGFEDEGALVPTLLFLGMGFISNSNWEKTWKTTQGFYGNGEARKSCQGVCIICIYPWIGQMNPNGILSMPQLDSITHTWNLEALWKYSKINACQNLRSIGQRDESMRSFPYQNHLSYQRNEIWNRVLKRFIVRLISNTYCTSTSYIA